MRATAIEVFALLTLTTAAAAQPINDPQRRAYVVPYVRRTTDCLAGQLMDAPDLVEIVRGNRIRDALAGPFRACADDVDAMIVAHDRAWFPGAGEQFFRGPYLADVPRAVQQRLQREIDRREQEAARTATEAAQRAAAAAEQQKAADAAAARLWAENDRRQALARQAQATPAPAPVQSQAAQQAASRGAAVVESDPRVRITSNAEDAAEQRISPLWYVFSAGVGWYLLKAAYREARRRKRRADLLAKYGDPDVVDRIMGREVWQGMTREQLIDSQGRPADIATDIKLTRVREIYKYGRTGVNRFRRRVTIDDGVVTGMADRGL